MRIEPRRPRALRLGAAFIVASYLWLETMALTHPTFTYQWDHVPAPGVTHHQER